MPLQNARFLLLSTKLAIKLLQIDTDLLRIITSSADEISGVALTSKTLNFKNRGEFFAISGCDAHLKSDFFLEITADIPRQPVHGIKLMPSRVSWALAQIF